MDNPLVGNIFKLSKDHVVTLTDEITLLDLFAAFAAQAIASNPGRVGDAKQLVEGRVDEFEIIAFASYKIAQAMLKERENVKGDKE
jgi:hypothetical protein